MGIPNRLLPFCQPSQEMHGKHQCMGGAGVEAGAAAG